MNWKEWLEKNQYDVDFGDDTIDLMKQAYVAGLQTAYDQMYMNEDGDYDFVMWQLKNLIGESE
jgi:hypothetical protein